MNAIDISAYTSNCQQCWEQPDVMGLTEVTEAKALSGGIWTVHEFRRAMTPEGVLIGLYCKSMQMDDMKAVIGYGVGTWESAPEEVKALFEPEEEEESDSMDNHPAFAKFNNEHTKAVYDDPANHGFTNIGPKVFDHDGNINHTMFQATLPTGEDGFFLRREITLLGFPLGETYNVYPMVAATDLLLSMFSDAEAKVDAAQTAAE